MADDNVLQFTGLKAVTPTPNEQVIKLLEGALEAAREGKLEFAAIVAMPVGNSEPIIGAAGEADPYRVIGALMRGAITNLGAGH